MSYESMQGLSGEFDWMNTPDRAAPIQITGGSTSTGDGSRPPPKTSSKFMVNPSLLVAQPMTGGPAPYPVTQPARTLTPRFVTCPASQAPVSVPAPACPSCEASLPPGGACSFSVASMAIPCWLALVLAAAAGAGITYLVTKKKDKKTPAEDAASAATP